MEILFRVYLFDQPVQVQITHLLLTVQHQKHLQELTLRHLQPMQMSIHHILLIRRYQSFQIS